MLKKFTLSIYFILIIHFAFSQGVAINEDNASADASAILDIKSTTKGLLIPRLTQAERDAITTPATGLMVFQTDGTAGFYYYNGTTWTAITPTVTPSWTLTGNNGTVAGTNFIGTTDNVPLEFRVNNLTAGYISGATNNYNTAFGYGTRSIGIANTAIGYNALHAVVAGGNTALGAGAFENGTPFRGVAIGNRAALNMGGSNNIAIGYDALRGSSTPTNNTGSNNIANGSQTLYSNTTGSNNIANGSQVLYNNTTGSNNIAIGESTMLNNVSGSQNVAQGQRALYSNIDGYGNVANGVYSLHANTSGFHNIANGLQALYSNTTGNHNIANGSLALYYNITGSRNIANGYQSMYNNNGSNNVAYGYSSLYSNTTGSNNVAIGYNATAGGNHNNVTALGANISITTDRTNVVAIGANITNANITQDNMTRIGNNSITKTDLAGTLTYNAQNNTTSNTFPNDRGTNGQVLTTDGAGQLSWTTKSAWGLTGNAGTVEGTNFIGNTDDVPLEFRVNNEIAGYISNLTSRTFVGYQAGYNTTTGNINTAIGKNALYYNISGYSNTAVGTTALFNSTGNMNIGIGGNAGGNITTGSNNIAIGNNAQVANNTASNQIRMGNTFISLAQIQVAWTVTSDKRWKNTIQNSDLGLNFITSLRPVSYFRNNDESKKLEYGFIAQELEIALASAGVTNSGILTKDDQGMLSVRYNDLFAPLVQSIKELKAENDALKAKIEDIEILETKNAALEAKLNELETLKAEVEQIKELLQLKASIKE